MEWTNFLSFPSCSILSLPLPAEMFNPLAVKVVMKQMLLVDKAISITPLGPTSFFLLIRKTLTFKSYDSLKIDKVQTREVGLLGLQYFLPTSS
jgi:hypothetical protein